MSRFWIVVGWLLVMVAVNASIVQTERHLRDGALVLLELAPVDPRSLMQGDYMALNFALTNDIRRAEKEAGHGLSENRDGQGIIELNEHGVASWVGLFEAQEVTAGQRVVRYRIRKGRVRFATDAYFFEEGSAEVYEQARYGAFRVSEAGNMLLVALYDQHFRELKPDAAN